MICRYFTFIVLFAFSVATQAQELENPDASSGGSGGRLSRESYRKKQDSIKANAIEPNVDLWLLKGDGSYKEKAFVDTSSMDTQVLYPIFRQSIHNTFTGNVGAAYENAIFSERQKLQDFLFLQPYEAYLNRPETHRFVDTRTPYTMLKYSTGGNNNRAENILNVLHTRNINKAWNVGLEYNLVSSDGQYQNQEQKDYNFTLFSSLDRERYKAYFILNHNRLDNNENGGVLDDSDISDTTVQAQNVEVQLIDVTSKQHNYNYFLSHQYNIGNKRDVVVYGDTTDVYPIKLVHTFHWDESERKYTDTPDANPFYEHFYYSATGTNEKTAYRNLKNSLQLVLNEGYFKWFQYGLRAKLQNEQIRYTLLDLKADYPFGQNPAYRKDTYSNTYFEGGAFFSSSEKSNWNASGKMYFEGYRAGDSELAANYTQYWGKEKAHRLKLLFEAKQETPNILLQNYFSNHQRWHNDFDRESRLKAGISYHHQAWNLEVGAYWETIDNYVYFGQEATPVQASSPVSIATAFAKKVFRWRSVYFDQQVYVQNSSNENVLSLPQVSLYSNNYFQQDLFKKAIKLRLGADIRYYTEFYASAYMPSIGQFYQQREKKLGSYPKVDLYLVARVKRLRFFAKYEHLNRVLDNSQPIFSALHYPITPGILKYGVRWHFFD